MEKKFSLISRATDYRFTLEFHRKSQSRAMGNTADTIRAQTSFYMSKSMANMLKTNGVIFSTLKHTDPQTVRGRPTLKDGVCNERIFRNGSSRELKIAKESNDLANVSLESNQKSNELPVSRKCGQSDRRAFADKDKVPRDETRENDNKGATLETRTLVPLAFQSCSPAVGKKRNFRRV